MLFQDMDRIVFAGDSVTDMGSVNPVGEGLFDNLGHSYVRIIENLLAALCICASRIAAFLAIPAAICLLAGNAMCAL